MEVKIRNSSVAHPLRVHVLSMVFVVYFGDEICSCIVTGTTFNKFGNTHLTYSRVHTQSVSLIACCSECIIHNWCRSLSHKLSTKECELSDVSREDIGSASEGNSEWLTFVIDCNTYLVSGPNGVNDSQLTQSSYYECIGTDRRFARFARLNSTGIHTGAWSAQNDTSIDEYVQVKTISAIALQGRSQDVPYKQYVTKFKVLTSLDCLTFSYITDNRGNAEIFAGNSHPEEIVTRYLQEWTLARCVRINPVQWVNWPSLRFDVLGC